MLEVKGYFTLKQVTNTRVFFGRMHSKQEEAALKKALLDRLYLPINDIALDKSGFFSIDPETGAVVEILDMSDVDKCFYYKEYAGVLIPTELSFLDTTIFATKRLKRLGGYNDTIRKMVILNSLRKGTLDDNFLFQ